MDTSCRNTLRQDVLTRRDALTGRERTRRSASINQRVLNHPQVTGAEVVFAYMHFRSEVQTLDLITSLLSLGKTVAIPYTMREENRLLPVRITDPELQTESGYCGIPEPLISLIEHETLPPAGIEVVMVPGSVFDRTGGRLGYGGGFYDRFLSQEAPRSVRIGVAYELQLVDRVPVEAHDQFMDFLVTEEKLYNCRR